MGGFSLLELLIVVTIIGILLAFSVGQVGQMIRTSREKATAATILKIDGLLQERRQAFERSIEQEKRSNASGWRRRLLAKRSVVPATEPLLEILVKKDLLLEHFSPLGSGPHDPKDETESAERLYFILTEGEVFGVAPVGAGEFSTSEVSDTDGDGLLEFVDGWGKPLRYYLWPTRLIRPGGPGTPVRRDAATLLISSIPPRPPTTAQIDELDQDPDDPVGRMSGELGKTGPALAALEAAYHTPDTYSVPLIVSAGADGILGLFEPTDTANLGDLARIPLGADGQPGVAGVNDDVKIDMNTTTDDAAELGAAGSDEYEPLTDNITNHNQRAGG